MSKNRVTIKDVAKEAGVSIATVSYVLNNTPGQSISDDTRKKVLQFANLLGYECNIMAKYLATGKTNTVSAVVKDIEPFASQYYLKMLTEMSRLLYRKNLGLKLTDYTDALARGGDCDAYITIALGEKDFRAFADTKYVPVVAIDSMFDDRLFYRINDDFERIYKSAVSEFGAPVTLLTFSLPQEVITAARKTFDSVIVVTDLNTIANLDKSSHYVTVSSSIADNLSDYSVKLENASFALKASTAVESVAKAINKSITQSSEESIDDHDLKV